jgi:methylthioribose-1-phosphate isomerase
MSKSQSVLTPPVPVVAWHDATRRAIRLLDQRALPAEERYVTVHTLDALVHAIRTLTVRGAPAIGVAAAMGLAAVAAHEPSLTHARLAELAETVAAARPTAVNLRWAVQRLLARAAAELVTQLVAALVDEAQRIHDEDVAMCRAIGEAGAGLLPDGARVLTHCNAGALATAGIGTALAPVYVAHARGQQVQVFADETRPLLQGARLTAWELARAGVPVTVLPDGAAASLLRQGAIDAVFVGADRIAANGDVANKVGTYALALAAREHGVPFHVCAPWSTIDAATPAGADIAIERRGREELALAGDRLVLPDGVPVFNPAFDVTPRALVTHYVTDRGLVTPPFTA